MTQDKTIPIHDVYDIITARMQVREEARRHGMSLTDQACISMATSSLANSLVSSDNGLLEGLISIECLEKGNQIGVRVTCRWQGIPDQPLPYGNERWMVDEIDIQQGENNTLQVVLTKWAVATAK